MAGLGASSAVLVLALSAGASAAPIREAGREQDFAPAAKESQERHQEGFLSYGAYLVNPGNSGNARPNATGSAFNRYQFYLQDSTLEDKLKFIGDIVFLTDKNRQPFRQRAMDYLLGASARRGSWRLQLDLEEDFPMDGPGRSFKYWDARGSLLFGDFQWGGAATGGYFLYNKGTPARPDGSGLAGARLSGHVHGVFAGGRLLLRSDAELFSDKSRPSSPASLDFSAGVGTAWRGLEFELSRESRESLDRPGYSALWLFSAKKRFDSESLVWGALSP